MAKNTSFLIYHENKLDSAAIELEIRRHKEYHIDRAANISEVLSHLLAGGVDCFICNYGKLDASFVGLSKKISSVSPKTVTLALFNEIDATVYEQLVKMKNLITLEKPLRNAAMSSICEKVVEGKEIHQRRHQRFSTEQSGSLEQVGGKLKTPVKILNMSKSGALIEVSEGDLREKDIVKISIPLSQINKYHVLHGRVMWIMHAQRGSKISMGIEFLNSNEAYVSLMDKG